MRVYTNQRRVKRGRFLATSLSISGVLMMLSSWASVVFVENTGLSTLPLLGFGMIFSLIGIRLSRKWVRLPIAHDSLASALKGIGKDSVLLNYWTPISHLLLTREGAFTLTTRNQPYNLLISGGAWKDHASGGEQLQRVFAMDTLGKPIQDAKHDAARAAEWIAKQLGHPIEVQPLIVFINPKTHLEVSEQSDIPVVYADKRTPTLKSYLKLGKSPLSPEDIDSIVASLEAH